jgi:hypothetical protein
VAFQFQILQPISGADDLQYTGHEFASNNRITYSHALTAADLHCTAI